MKIPSTVPKGIIRQFNLRHLPALVRGGFYRKLAVYGQVGRMDIGRHVAVAEQEASWHLDKAEAA